MSDSDSDQDAFASGRGGGISELRGRAGSDWDAVGVGDELSWLERARARTAEVLQERKKIKRRLGLAAQRFNSGSKEWLEYAQVSGPLTGSVRGKEADSVLAVPVQRVVSLWKLILLFRYRSVVGRFR